MQIVWNQCIIRKSSLTKEQYNYLVKGEHISDRTLSLPPLLFVEREAALIFLFCSHTQAQIYIQRCAKEKGIEG